MDKWIVAAAAISRAASCGGDPVKTAAGDPAD
jgi:hypothetical protein